MIDFELEAASEPVSFDIPHHLDTVMLYVYEGKLASINEQDQTPIDEGSVVLVDADSNSGSRTVQLAASKDAPGKVLLFAGAKVARASCLARSR